MAAEREERQNYFSGQVLELWLEEGILIGTYKVTDVDLEAARLATRERLIYVENKSYLNLVDYRKVRKTDKEARNYFSSEIPSRGIRAMAVIIDSLIGMVIFNFYIRFNKPPYPMQVFNDPKLGMQWLKQYR